MDWEEQRTLARRAAAAQSLEGQRRLCPATEAWRQALALESAAIEVYAQYPYWPASSRNTRAFRRTVFNLLAHAQVQGLLHALPFYTTE